MRRWLRGTLSICGLLAALAAADSAHAAPSDPSPRLSTEGQALPQPSVASTVAPAAFRCAPDEDCSERWQVLIGMLVATGSLGGIVYIVRRAQRPAPLHLVSVLVALDATGASIKGRLAQLTQRSKLPNQDLRQCMQRACGVLLDQHGAWTHAGTLGSVELAGARAFAKWRSELGSRDRVHHASYQGAASYTVVALLLSTRERPPSLAAPGRQQVEDYLRALARLHPQAFEVVCLPVREREMTLRELIDRYPELFPLDAYLSRANVG
jgi:hypothetical protein